MLGGTANLTRNAADFPGSLRQVLEALEEQVVVLKLLAAAQDPGTVTVRIGEENEAEQMRSTSRGVHRLRQRRHGLGGHGGGRARPGWTTRERSPRCARSPDTSARSCVPVTHDVEPRLHERVPRRATAAGRRSGVARDYYGLLGVAKNATRRARSSAPTASWRVSCIPTSTPTRPPSSEFKEVTAAYEVLSDPEKRQIVDLGGDPLEPGGRAGRSGGDPFGGIGPRRHHGRLLRRRRRRPGGRGPRTRVRQGRRRADPGRSSTLEECATGVTKDLTVDTAMLCDRCHGLGCAPGHQPGTCDTCGGAGEVQQRAAFAARPGRDLAPVPGLPRLRRGHPRPVPAVQRRRPGPGPPRPSAANIPAGVGDGIRVRLAGQGEVGPGGGPAGDLYVEVQELPHDEFTRDGIDLHCTVHVPMTAAALGTSMLHDPRRHRGPGHPARHPVRHRDHPARPGHAPAARHGPRRPRQPARAHRGGHPDQAGRPAGRTAARAGRRCAARSSPTGRPRPPAACSPGSATPSVDA